MDAAAASLSEAVTLTFEGTTLVVSGVTNNPARLYFVWELDDDMVCNPLVREAAAVLFDRCRNKGLTDEYFDYARFGCFYLAIELFQESLVSKIPVRDAPPKPVPQEMLQNVYELSVLRQRALQERQRALQVRQRPRRMRGVCDHAHYVRLFLEMSVYETIPQGGQGEFTKLVYVP